MSIGADAHTWSPAVVALEYPEYFYPLLLLMFLVAAVVWWWIPYSRARDAFLNDDAKRHETETSLRTAISLFYTGSVVAFGIIGAVIQFQANAERDFQQQASTLSAQNATRFDNAVGQLKTPDSPLQVLGAISIFNDLIKQDGFYWPTVAEISEYVRLAAQQKGDINRPEIVNALVLLSQRDWSLQGTEPYPLDFSGLDLHGLQFSTLQLWGSNFQSANLSNAMLPGAKLEGADLYCVNFENAKFQMNSLSKSTTASELGPKLENANFRHADLSNVSFAPHAASVDAKNACFEDATLTGADISRIDLSNVAGLTLDQINSASKINPPKIPSGYTKKECQSFTTLCRDTPGSK